MIDKHSKETNTYMKDSNQNKLKKEEYEKSDDNSSHLIVNELNDNNDILLYFFKLYRTGKYIFRGISHPNQNNPSILRSGESYQVNLKDQEYSMLYDFIRLGARHFSLNYDMLDYVACAQHYGVPTRLLDWTRNPFVALFFAINRKKDKEDQKYEIYVAELKEQIIIESDFPPTTVEFLINMNEVVLKYKTFIKSIKEMTDNGESKYLQNLKEQVKKFSDLKITLKDFTNPNGMLIFDPPIKNSRLNAQKGLFQIPRDISDKKVVEEVENNSETININIENETRLSLLKELYTIGYSNISLFPELEKIGQHIENIALNKYNN